MTTDDVVRALALADDRGQLLRALNANRQTMVVTARRFWYEGHTTREIARLLGVSHVTVAGWVRGTPSSPLTEWRSS